MASIDLQGVSKIYANGTHGVRDITLSIDDGEFVIFLGPSGCGKSTTLRMIAGLESISSGELFINGREMTRVAPRSRNVAVVFQSYALYPHMSVRANMGFGLKMRGASNAEISRKTLESAELLGLTQLLDRKPAELSGGQRQRVALGRAIVREPDVFLFDEPLSNLDAQLRAEMRLELVRLHRRVGRTTIHVTHDQVEAMTMGDRICVMREGHLIQYGHPLDIYADPNCLFVANFLSSPPMNLVPVDVEGDSERIFVRLGPTTKLEIPKRHQDAYAGRIGKRTIFGLRPEDVHEVPRGTTTQPISLQVRTIESLGPETIISGSIEKNDLGGEPPQVITARLSRHVRVRIGEQITLHADLTPMHLFDPNNQMAIPRAKLGRAT